MTSEQQMLVYISTGRKGVMHTLWTEIIQPPMAIKMDDGTEFVSPGWTHHCYIKNLSMNESEAISKAKVYAESMRFKFLGIWDSPYNERADWMDRWGIHFQSKKKKGKLFFQGKANSEFWESWKANKDQIKKEGFWVSKYKYKDERGNEKIEWFVFYKPQIKLQEDKT